MGKTTDQDALHAVLGNMLVMQRVPPERSDEWKEYSHFKLWFESKNMECLPAEETIRSALINDKDYRYTIQENGEYRFKLCPTPDDWKGRGPLTKVPLRPRRLMDRLADAEASF